MRIRAMFLVELCLSNFGFTSEKIRSISFQSPPPLYRFRLGMYIRRKRLTPLPYLSAYNWNAE